ncbi:MAG TPA: hypothetical protein VFW60_05620 [Rhodanobacteraceae bacterium]|nr:hypothetical protein [Rhodanobacteraceae bacterium]
MKKLVIATGTLLLAPLVVHAACTTANFEVASFQVMTGNVSNPIMKMPGKLVNNCKQAAAAQILIEAKADDGSVVEKRKFWPAGTANISPGDSVKFDAGRMFRFSMSIKTYSVAVVAVRTW